MAEQTSTQLDSTRVRELIREFMETESMLQEAVGGAVDAVLDPETGTPVLLRRAQAELRLLLQQLPAIAWTVDRELRFTSLQGTGLAALDPKPGNLVGRHLSEVSPMGAPDEELLKAHRRALEGEPGELVLHQAGWVWQVHVEALSDAEGNAAGVVGVALDTTARAQAEAEVRRMRDELEEIVQLRTRELVLANEELAIAGEELRVQNDDLLATRRELEAERQRYQELFALAPDGYVVTDCKGVVEEANRAAAAMLGTPDGSLVGESLAAYIHPRDRGSWYLHLTALQSGEESAGPWEMQLRPAGREPFFASVTGSASVGKAGQGGSASLRWLIRDVSARKEAEREREWLLAQAQEARQQSEDHAAVLDAVISSITDGIILYDAEGRVSRTNAAAGALLGLSASDWELSLAERLRRAAVVDANGQPLQPDGLPVARALRGETVHGVVGRRGQANGAAGLRWLLTSAAPVYDRHGEMRGAVLILTDITELRYARDELEQRVAERTLDLRSTLEALRVSEERFRELAENIDELFWLMETGTHRILYVSPTFEKLWGWPVREIFERPERAVDAIHPEDRDRVLAAWASNAKEFNQEFRILWPDASVRWLHAQTFPVETVEGPAQRIAGVAADITEEKHAQAAVVQMERLLVAARLAASLAHEINNPLQSAVGCLDLASEALADGHDPGPYLAVVSSAMDRARAVVVQLRTLHRQPEMEERRPAALNALITKLLPLTEKRSEAGGIEVILKLEETLPPLMVMPEAISQVFQHLVINALDAMPEGGQLRIEGQRTCDPDGVWIRFADTGMGLPPEMWDHLFEPFHSTKSEGLGLGLFISQNIVHQHGGQITVQPRAGGGTIVGVWLPVS